MIGRLRDDSSPNRWLNGYRVTLSSRPGTVSRGGRAEFSDGLKSAWTEEAGRFELRDYSADGFERQRGHPRPLELVVQDKVGRVVARFALEDQPGEGEWNIGDRIIPLTEAEGYLVTLGTGEHQLYTRGNAVTWLSDDEVFEHAAALIGGAKTADLRADVPRQILVSQLYFQLPPEFHAVASSEATNLVFKFREPPPDREHLRPTDAGDTRPERLLLDAADNRVDVRILLHAYELPLFIKIVAGVLVFPFAGSAGVHAITGRLRDALTDTDEVKHYFGGSGRSTITVQPFQQSVLSAGVMHCKLLIVNGTHALSIGAPFEQFYIDTHEHRIDEPKRGADEELPMHDVGFAVAGPAVFGLHQTMRLLWNTEAPRDTIKQLAGPWHAQHEGGDAICSMQIVRTLGSGKLRNVFDHDQLHGGEQGILEAYLRAIGTAKNFIYLETQYMTNDAIGRALVQAINRAKERQIALQVIVVLNIRPDHPTYSFWQWRLITCIRRDIGWKPTGPQRFGVFTRWTYEPGPPRPRMIPVYVHSKVGIVDDAWATVGSANLDGISLDSYGLSAKFGREQRAIEVNAVMLNDVESAPPSAAVEILRRKLWAEHLGYFAAPGRPEIAAEQLMNPPDGGWLSLWSERAEATRRQLAEKPLLPHTNMARILPWPNDDTTYKTPRKYLNALGIPTYTVVPLKSTRSFDFKTGAWTLGSKAKMDYN
jgi:phosphatidylserine/phosphatidylglycerophosphate/cardiolipin synthase-like enzyme